MSVMIELTTALMSKGAKTLKEASHVPAILRKELQARDVWKVLIKLLNIQKCFFVHMFSYLIK